MLDRFQHLVRNYLPLTVASYDSDVGPRIGGLAPTDVVPKHVSPRTRYFLTIPLSDSGGLDISIFYSLDDDVNSPRCGLLTWGRIHPASSDLVEAVLHQPRPRAQRGQNSVPSDLSSHALIIGPPQPEPQDEEPTFSGFDGDKMGGIPRYDQNKDPIYTEAREIAAAGFVHLLQIDSYGPRGGPLERGLLPFGNHIFHTWARWQPSKGFEVRFGWA
jgi:hypothetical protein